MTFQAPAPADSILWDVVEEHLHEAEWLFEIWKRRLGASHYRVDELGARVESRLAAHLDGLAVGGPPVAESMLYPLLEEAAEARLATVAALVLLGSDDGAEVQRVFEATEAAEGEQQAALALALKLTDNPQVPLALVSRFENSKDLDHKAFWLGLVAAHHENPGPTLEECLRSTEVPLASAAMTAAARAARRDLAPHVEQLTVSDDRILRSAAVEAGMLLGLPKAWSECHYSFRGDPGPSLQEMLFLALLGNRRDHERLEALAKRRSTVEAALWTMGFTGSVECVECCLPFLSSDDERLVKLAAEALAATAGFDLHASELRRGDKTTEVEQPIPLEEDDLDADLVPDGVDALPAVDPGAVKARWSEARGQLKRDRRYLLGAPFNASALVQALHLAPMRRRHAYALELAVRTACNRQVTSDAFASRQLRQLRALSGLAERELIFNPGGSW